jgi:hypothetical protein
MSSSIADPIVVDVSTVIKSLKSSDLTSATFMSAVVDLVAHAQTLTGLTGAQKKHLVIASLTWLAEQAPFPQNKVLGPLVANVAPIAIDQLVSAAKAARVQFNELSESSAAKDDKDDVRKPEGAKMTMSVYVFVIGLLAWIIAGLTLNK